MMDIDTLAIYKHTLFPGTMYERSPRDKTGIYYDTFE